MATDLTNYNNPYERSPGLSSVGSYLMAGKPYFTGAALVAGEEKVVEFPNVTKKLFIQPMGTAINISAASTGSMGSVVAGKHFLSVPTDGIEIDIMCSKLYVHAGAPGQVASFQIYASLTGIGVDNMFHLTGSGITE